MHRRRSAAFEENLQWTSKQPRGTSNTKLSLIAMSVAMIQTFGPHSISVDEIWVISNR